MASQEEMQQHYALYQMLQSRLEEIKQQLGIVQTKLVEFENTKAALEAIESAKAQSDVLVPLGSGCYTQGKIDANEKILTDLGVGIMAKKDIASAKEFVEKRKVEMEEASGILQTELIDIANKMNEISAQLQQLVQESQKPAEGTGTAG